MLFRIVAVSVFVFAPALRSFANTVSFDPAVNYPVGTSPQSLAIADLNHDGRPDIVTANNGSNNVSVLLNTGNGSFGPATNFAVGNVPQSVAIADVNLDGKPDLAVANGGKISILLGTGTGSFGSATDFDADFGAYSVAIGDLNLDGKPDIAAMTFGGLDIIRGASIFLGTGTGTFGPATRFEAGGFMQRPGNIVIHDVNVDGKLDLALAQHHEVVILLGDGTGSFGAPLSSGVVNAVSVAIGDLNNDGKPDLASANPGAFAYIFLGTDGGFAQETENRFPILGGLAIAMGDINLDGKPDLVMTGANGVFVFLGAGDGSFGPAINFSAGEVSFGSAVVIKDLNIDGKPDLAVLNGDNVSILLNSQVIPVEIDIRPWSSSNQVNPRAKGMIPVAILSTATFDAGSVKLSTVRFGATGSEAMAKKATLQDADGDLDLDLVMQFSIPDTGIACGMTSASLKGETFGGQKVQGSDSISTVGCK